MKKLIAFLLLITLALPLTSCNADGKYFTCDEIIEAYESAGYTVRHTHESYAEGGICSLTIYKSGDDYYESHDFIEIEIFENEEYAKAYNDERQFNWAVWTIFAMCGEPRWLHTERYGNVHVEYYPNEFIKPLKDLIKTK